jgi:hypothetical protein
MACIPYEAVYGCYLGVMFSSRTRFLIKQLVRYATSAFVTLSLKPSNVTAVLCMLNGCEQVVMLAALKTADGSAVGVANHAAALLKAPV